MNSNFSRAHHQPAIPQGALQPLLNDTILISTVASKVFLSLIFAFSAGAFGHLFSTPNTLTAPASDPTETTQTIAWLAIYAYCLLRTIRSPTSLSTTLGRIWPITALSAIALCSVFWSLDPRRTFLQAVALIGTLTVSLFIATQYSVPTIVRVFTWSASLLIVLSVALVFIAPSIAIQYELRGAWQGLFVHKNIFGRLIAFTAAMWLVVPLRVDASWARIVPLTLLVPVAIKCDSVTAVWVTTILLFSHISLTIVRRNFFEFGVFLSTIILLGVLAMMFAVYTDRSISSLLGRDSTLTGRTALWPLVIDAILHRPFFGYGYQVFWRVPDGPATQIWSRTFVAGHSHNGFLELALDLGLVGLALYFLALIQCVARQIALVRSRNLPRLTTQFTAIVLTYTIAYNLTESTLVIRNSLYWILFIVVCAKTAMRFPAAARAQSRVAPHKRIQTAG